MSKDEASQIVALAIEFFDLAATGHVPAVGFGMLAAQLEDLRIFLDAFESESFRSN